MNEVWITNKDIDNTKTLAYICGIRETIDEVLKLIDKPCDKESVLNNGNLELEQR